MLKTDCVIASQTCLQTDKQTDRQMKCHSKSENGEFRRQNANIDIKFWIKKFFLQHFKHIAGFFS